MQRKTVLFHNKLVYYNISGSGEAILIIHGFGANAQIWENVLPMLDADYLYIVPELPGSGFSEVVSPVSIHYMAELMQVILFAEQKNACVILGHSMGGYIALQFAEMFPDIVQGIGLIHSHAYADDEAKKISRYKSAEFIERNGSSIFLDEFVPKMFAESTSKDVVNYHRKLIDNTPTEGLAADLQAMATRQDKSNLLSRFQKPVLFMMGAKDTIMPLEFLLKQAPLPKIAQVEILNNSGHMSMIEQPEACAAAINSFIDFCKTKNQ